MSIEHSTHSVASAGQRAGISEKNHVKGDAIMLEDIVQPALDVEAKAMDHVPSSEFDNISRLETFRKFWKVSRMIASLWS